MQVNTHVKTLAEIYTIYSFAPLGIEVEKSGKWVSTELLLRPLVLLSFLSFIRFFGFSGILCPLRPKKKNSPEKKKLPVDPKKTYNEEDWEKEARK